MSHSLHRFRKDGCKVPNDYVMITLAAQGLNSQGAENKLRTMYNILRSEDPVNYGEDNQGGLYSGKTVEEILENITDRSNPTACFDSIEKVKGVLQKAKEADTGMSVVLTGDYDTVFDALDEMGLTPHSVNVSIGYFGNLKALPPEEILEISSMCGHCMVCPDHIEKVIDKVKRGIMTAEAAAKDLAKPCSCSVFNPVRAQELIEKICDR
ncbi:MAG: hypothetical protein IJQ42_06700 [Oscillospiraceae bacterium]|nr:hypothetical protein [Oscillospiraceae bacterium]